MTKKSKNQASQVLANTSKYADGGDVEFGKHDSGLFHSDTGGRADKLKTDVPTDSFIVPADVVSALGQGNTMAGSKVLDHIVPWPEGPKKMAKGGSVMPGVLGSGGAPGSTPIMASGGEYAIHPKRVAALGGGDLTHGHEILKHFVINTRRNTAKMLNNLKPPPV